MAGPPAGAGGAVAGTVEGEIVRRQAEIFDAERLIAEGDEARLADNWRGAVEKYGQAYLGLTPSPLAEETIGIARKRFSAASVRHALELIDAAEFAQAETVLARVLQPSVDPDYVPALTVKARLADPEWYNRARTPKHLANVEKVKEALTLAQGSMLLADYDKALEYYTQVLRIDRYNSAARRGMQEAEHAIATYAGAARDHTRTRMMREVDQAWETEVEISGAFGLGDGSGAGERIAVTSMEERIAKMVLDQVNLDEATLEETVEFLVIKSKQADPAGGGINIVLNLDPDDAFARNSLVSLLLRNVPMLEALKYVTQATRTNYRIDGFAVKIESLATADKSLISKRFRVPPDFLSSESTSGDVTEDPFAATVESAGGGLKLKRLTAKEFLSNQGVTFPDGASAVFLPANSMLIVRNTQSNLQIIESIVNSSFGGVPKQVEVHVTMIDVAQSDFTELGFDWLLGQANIPGSDRAFTGGGTLGNSPGTGSIAEGAADFPFFPPGTNIPLGNHPVTSGLRSGRQWDEGDAINDILLDQGQSILSNPSSLRSPSFFSVGGVLTDPQFQFIMRGLAQKKGSDILIKPSIVTRSGQRASIDVVREFPYPTEYDPPEIPQDQGLGNIVINPANPLLGVPGGLPITPAHPAAFEVRNLGSHLEVEPIVGEDDYTVELNLSPHLVRFEGFINYGSPVSTGATDVLGGVISIALSDNRILQPVFKTIQMTDSVVVWDGAIVAIGGLIEDKTTRIEDKTPLFGDAPLIGRFFRSNGETRSMRVVMFFVKVHVIDPAGKRINVR